MSWRNIYFPEDANENLNIDIIIPGGCEVKKCANYFDKMTYLSSAPICFHFPEMTIILSGRSQEENVPLSLARFVTITGHRTVIAVL